MTDSDVTTLGCRRNSGTLSAVGSVHSGLLGAGCKETEGTTGTSTFRDGTCLKVTGVRGEITKGHVLGILSISVMKQTHCLRGRASGSAKAGRAACSFRLSGETTP